MMRTLSHRRPLTTAMLRMHSTFTKNMKIPLTILWVDKETWISWHFLVRMTSSITIKGMMQFILWSIYFDFESWLQRLRRDYVYELRLKFLLHTTTNYLCILDRQIQDIFWTDVFLNPRNSRFAVYPIASISSAGRVSLLLGPVGLIRNCLCICKKKHEFSCQKQ